MEIIIVIGIVVIIALLVILFFKISSNNIDNPNNESNQGFQYIINNQSENFNKLIDKSEQSFIAYKQLDTKFENVNKIIQELAKESYQSSLHVEDISQRVIALNDIMVNKKARGNWGEYQLNNLLSVYAGDNQNIFETQYSLKNGSIGDVALHIPDTKKVMIIDSKFPLENYQNQCKEDISDIEKNKYQASFKGDIKNILMIFQKSILQVKQ